MTLENKMQALRVMSGETNTEVLSVFLDLAGKKIIERCYPFRSDVSDVPEKYEMNQLEIAAYMLNKRGAEGETVHKENGIDRTFESASVPDSMLKGIVPFVSVFP